jgi:hypothetical protein
MANYRCPIPFYFSNNPSTNILYLPGQTSSNRESIDMFTLRHANLPINEYVCLIIYFYYGTDW